MIPQKKCISHDDWIAEFVGFCDWVSRNPVTFGIWFWLSNCDWFLGGSSINSKSKALRSRSIHGDESWWSLRLEPCKLHFGGCGIWCQKWKGKIWHNCLNTNLSFPIFPGSRTRLRHVCGRASRSQQECTPKVLGGSLQQLGWRTQGRPSAVCCRSNFDPRPSIVIIYFILSAPNVYSFCIGPRQSIWCKLSFSKTNVIKCGVLFRFCWIAMVRAEKEGARTRNKLIKQLEDPRCRTSQLENLLNKMFVFIKTNALGLVMSDWIFKVYIRVLLLDSSFVPWGWGLQRKTPNDRNLFPSWYYLHSCPKGSFNLHADLLKVVRYHRDPTDTMDILTDHKTPFPAGLPYTGLGLRWRLCDGPIANVQWSHLGCGGNHHAGKSAMVAGVSFGGEGCFFLEHCEKISLLLYAS